MAKATCNFTVRWIAGPVGNVTAFDPVSSKVSGATDQDDISSLVISASIRRGRNDPAGNIATGTCTIKLRDPAGWFIPGYSGSPIVGGAADGIGNLKPYRTLRIIATYDNGGGPVQYVRFYGYITRITPDTLGKTATIEASDALHRLTLPLKQNYVSGAPGTTSNAILFFITTRFGGDYSYASSDAGNSFSASLTAAKDAVPSNLIGNVLQADRGLFYVKKDGIMQYLDRHWHDRSPRDVAQSTLSNVQLRQLNTGIDVATVFNAATVTARGDLIAAPGAGPTVTSPAAVAPATSSLPPGDYNIGYSYTNGGGETAMSPLTTVTTAANDVVHVAAVTPLPAGATGVNWYMSVTTGATSVRLVRSGTGAAEDFETLPNPGAALPLVTGTARYAVAQTVTDGTSEDDFDPRPGQSLTTPYLDTNAQARDTASWVVAGGKEIAPRGYACDLDGNLGGATLVAMLARDLHDRVNLASARIDAADYYIIGINETITDTRKHTVTWLLQKRRARDAALIIGYSKIGESALGYVV